MVQHGLRPSNKLSHTVFGPFPIVKQHTANSFELDLGASANKRVINIFHVKYLRHAPENDPYRKPISLLPVPVTGFGEDEEWELEKIVDSKRIRGKTEYLVQYKGFPLYRDMQWRPEAELKELASRLLKDFQRELKKSEAKT